MNHHVSNAFQGTAPNNEIYPLYDDDALENLPNQKWIIDQVLMDGGIAALYGPAGVSKTFFALDLAFKVTHGYKWFGNETTQKNVIYCYFEGKSGLKKRVSGIKTKWPEFHGKNITYFLEELNLKNETELKKLVATLTANKIESPLIIIDTFNAVSSGIDENDSRSMSTITSALKKIRELTNASILIVHHSGKDPSKGMRGHSSLNAAVDTEISLTKRKGNVRKWEVTKSRDSEDLKSGFYSLEPIVLDERQSTCVVIELSDFDESSIKKHEPTGKHQIVAFAEIKAALSNLASKEGESIFAVKLSLEKAHEVAAAKLDCLETRKMERAKIAIKDLLHLGFLVLDGVYYKLPSDDS